VRDYAFIAVIVLCALLGGTILGGAAVFLVRLILDQKVEEEEEPGEYEGVQVVLTQCAVCALPLVEMDEKLWVLVTYADPSLPPVLLCCPEHLEAYALG
jgi:hypothetical protein